MTCNVSGMVGESLSRSIEVALNVHFAIKVKPAVSEHVILAFALGSRVVKVVSHR